MWPAARIQPNQHQSRSDAHHAEAYSQPGSSHSSQREAEPGDYQTNQGKDVHAEQNVFGEHCVLELVKHAPWSKQLPNSDRQYSAEADEPSSTSNWYGFVA